MTLSLASTTTYQATDLARNHREVLERARHGGALIRDKDGTTLLIAPADDVVHDRQLAELAADFVRTLVALNQQTEQRSAASYGAFAWLTVFEDEYQREFLREIAEPLLVALAGGPTGPVTELIEDWRISATTYSDKELRHELTRSVPRPVYDVEL